MTSKPTLDDGILWALCLFAFAVIFSVTAVEAALFIVLILLLAKKRRDNDLLSLPAALPRHPLFVPWMAYLGICLLTSLTAYYPAKGLGQLNSDFLKYLCLSTLLFSVRKGALPRLSAIYTAGAVVAALIGIGEVFVSIAAGNTDVARANAFMNAVRYGEVMTLAFALVFSRVLLPEPAASPRERLGYKLAAIIIFSALLLSQTRGAYLGLVTAVVTAAIFSRAPFRKLLSYGAALIAVTAALALTNPTIRARFAVQEAPLEKQALTAAEGSALSVNIRLELWKLGLKMFQAHPVLGIGPDNVKKVFKRFHPEPIAYNETWGSLHNLYIHQAAERGILGLGALLMLFAAFFRFALANFRRTRSAYALWAAAALPAYFVMNLTEISFQHVHTSFAIFLAMAFGAASDAAS